MQKKRRKNKGGSMLEHIFLNSEVIECNMWDVQEAGNVSVVILESEKEHTTLLWNVLSLWENYVCFSIENGVIGNKRSVLTF